MVVAQVGEQQFSPSAVAVARVAADQGMTSSEVRGDLALRGRLTLAAGESKLDDAEWAEVCALLSRAHARAAAAHPKSSGTCGSCGQAVRWVETVNGKRMMLDPLPCPERGNVELRPSGAKVLAFVNSPSSVPLPGSRPVFRAHAATCPRQQRRVSRRPVKSKTPLCVACQLPMDQKMHDMGERTHPTCGEVSRG